MYIFDTCARLITCGTSTAELTNRCGPASPSNRLWGKGKDCHQAVGFSSFEVLYSTHVRHAPIQYWVLHHCLDARSRRQSRAGRSSEMSAACIERTGAYGSGESGLCSIRAHGRARNVRDARRCRKGDADLATAHAVLL